MMPARGAAWLREPLFDRTSIADVTDTALWVAALRAREQRRVNAVIDDPWAASLAGPRGERIARLFPQPAVIEWAVVIRTCALDRLIIEALGDGVDTIVNLGAGLDSRPYRLGLSKQTRWIEVDFPKLIAAKNAALAAHSPACVLERVGMDLRDRPARRELFARIGAESRRGLVIAEGLVPYLSAREAAELAADLLEVPALRRWLLDFDNAGARPLPRSWAKRLRDAPMLFQVPDWFKFFEECGWRTLRVISSAEESERLGRPYPVAVPLGLLMRLLPREMARRILSASGAALLEAK